MGISRIVILDVDGVLTDNTVTYSSLGSSSKRYHIDDGYWLKKIMALSPVYILSGHNCRSVIHRFKHILDESHIVVGVKDKFVWISENIDLKPDTFVVVVGNGFSDLSLIETGTILLCPQDSIEEIKEKASRVLPVNGGNGVLGHVYDMLIELPEWRG